MPCTYNLFNTYLCLIFSLTDEPAKEKQNWVIREQIKYASSAPIQSLSHVKGKKDPYLPAVCVSPTCKKENILLALLLIADIVHSDVNMTACLFDIQIKKAVYKPVAIFLSAKDVKCDFRLKGSNPDCVCSFLLIYFVINTMWTVPWFPSCYTILKINITRNFHITEIYVIHYSDWRED